MKDMIGEVVTAVSLVGEVVGRLKSVDDEGVTLESPRTFVPGENNQGGFAPGVSLTGRQHLDEVTITRSQVIFVVPTHEMIEKGWIEATSGLIV